ncbi:N-acetylmuramoyl-L-alanine amidase [Prevotella copri]|jgi:N-acetylmuramoyl-L-alanine amidase|uniref:N-acetylmuramoyl-L-alanine amidase n=1 Tax=Segatella copri TaxID=165179 RepID=A0AAW5INF7_9BACT|nr:N-acetylmuramoyl-L-alanine amidase [Segatella copri]MCP9534691.1 N-acetylmuramoyl-L-alanine amidase [Segatella copri]MCP9537600.1 N-acetylmuramoyl-L-alanine amidase [Segatella copri]MCP9540541.1 N-acetylmuramoyl-L-alanine amidase [Segatella copri]MCP9558812.1 N-acetylmuramoyl-L-alanine amidase [Segatella copri]MCP9561480.1 N-acetylmuramoyl-L-alanine amidase [Segatella copri]
MCKKVTLIWALMCMFVMTSLAANKRFTLVIDPGHGGHDAGALGAISKEKNINLAVALRFGKYVEQNLPEVRVIYTRKTDVFIPLNERANIANRANADLFISVHTNALPAGKVARGFETYTLGMHRAKDNLDVAMRENSVISMEKDYQQRYQGFDPRSSESYIIFEFIQGKNMERSVELARMIQRSVCDGANRPDKGVHQAGFLVLRETSMPGCLIELGFITTPDEERLLNDDSRVDDIARGIYEAFAKYKNKYDKSVSVPYRAKDSEDVNLPKIVPDQEPAPKTRVVTRGKQSKREEATPEQPKREVKKLETKKDVKKAEVADAPVFKLQIFVGSRNLRKGDAHFKGETDYDSFQEGNLVKYTLGASTNYNEIYRLRKEKLEKFPEAFIIAFKNGQKYDVNQAIREFKQNRNR